MSEKFIKIKRVIVPAACIMLAVMQLTGCGVATADQLADMIATGEQIEINIELPSDSEELQGTPVEWIALSYLTDQEDLRDKIDDILGIISYGESKNGVLYVNPETEEWEPNNTLEQVYKNKAYTELIEDNEVKAELEEAVLDSYVDLDESTDSETLKLVLINAYFNLFPTDETNAEFNGGSYLTRAQYMCGLAKAHLQAQDGATASADTIEQIGDNEYAVYAELMSDKAYLDIESKSLNEKNFYGLITRAEVAYLIVNTYYADELAVINTESKPSTYSDTKNAGDMSEDAGTTGQEQYKAANLSYMIDNPSKGMDEELYKAMVVAYNHNLLGDSTESRWNDPITKAEALQMLVGVYEEAGTTIKCQNGSNVKVGLSADDDINNLDSDLIYTINGKEYTASQFENAGTVAFLMAYDQFPPMTYLEWQEEIIPQLNSVEYEIYMNHTSNSGEDEQLIDLNNEQLFWLSMMENAIFYKTSSPDVYDMTGTNGIIEMANDCLKSSLEDIYFGNTDAELTDEEKIAFEKEAGWYKEPEVVYASNSSSNNSSSTSSSSTSESSIVYDYGSSSSGGVDGSGYTQEQIDAALASIGNRAEVNENYNPDVQSNAISGTLYLQ